MGLRVADMLTVDTTCLGRALIGLWGVARLGWRDVSGGL